MKVPFSRLFALCREKAALFPLGIVCSSLVGGIMPCFALALASIIAAFLRPPTEMTPEIRKWCLIFLGIAVGSFFAGLGQMWALGVIGSFPVAAVHTTLPRNHRIPSFSCGAVNETRARG